MTKAPIPPEKKKSSYMYNSKTPPKLQEKKKEIWLSPMTKSPTPTEKSKKQRDNIKKTPPKLWLHNDCGPT